MLGFLRQPNLLRFLFSVFHDGLLKLINQVECVVGSLLFVCAVSAENPSDRGLLGMVIHLSKR
jgi:hypothetical protein